MNQLTLSDEDQKLVDDYLSTLVAVPHNTTRLFAIGFIGLPGTGKSTVADMLQARIGLPVSRNDQIRRYLNRLGFQGASPKQELMRDFAELRTAWYYRHQKSAIVDANFTEQWQRSQKLAADFGATLLLIRISCNEHEALRRIDARLRAGDGSGSSQGDREAYMRAIKQLCENPIPDTEIFFQIDTQQPLDSQLDRLVARLRQDGYVEE